MKKTLMKIVKIKVKLDPFRETLILQALATPYPLPANAEPVEATLKADANIIPITFTAPSRQPLKLVVAVNAKAVIAKIVASADLAKTSRVSEDVGLKSKLAFTEFALGKIHLESESRLKRQP